MSLYVHTTSLCTMIKLLIHYTTVHLCIQPCSRCGGCTKTALTIVRMGLITPQPNSLLT